MFPDDFWEDAANSLLEWLDDFNVSFASGIHFFKLRIPELPQTIACVSSAKAALLL